MNEFTKKWKEISAKDRESASPAKNSHTGGPRSHRLAALGLAAAFYASGGDGPVISETLMNLGLGVGILSLAHDGHTVAFRVLRKAVRVARDTSLVAKNMLSRFNAATENLTKRNNKVLETAKAKADTNRRIDKINETKNASQPSPKEDKTENNGLIVERPFDEFMKKSLKQNNFGGK